MKRERSIRQKFRCHRPMIGFASYKYAMFHLPWMSSGKAPPSGLLVELRQEKKQFVVRQSISVVVVTVNAPQKTRPRTGSTPVSVSLHSTQSQLNTRKQVGAMIRSRRAKAHQPLHTRASLAGSVYANFRCLISEESDHFMYAFSAFVRIVRR